MTDNLGNYLGVPLLHNRVNKHTYKGVLDKVQQRLTGWNALHLFLAGRVTLVQSVIQSILIYTMQTARLPSILYDQID